MIYGGQTPLKLPFFFLERHGKKGQGRVFVIGFESVSTSVCNAFFLSLCNKGVGKFELHSEICLLFPTEIHMKTHFTG
jgi:hypothetical protein